MKKILIIAGEASSDMHAAELVKQIHLKDKEISFYGLGGEKMRNANVKLLENIVQFAFIGPAGLFKHYIKLKSIYDSLCDHIKKDRPDCAILIDYAEFNLRVAKELKKLNIPVIYYVSPQIWAWGLWRIKTIRILVDKMLVFFKFEEELYKRNNVNASFVGHPLLDIVTTKGTPAETRRRLKIEEGTTCIGILPGSRKNEIE
ncbi:MAG: lipid-A-disaccharide synthase, partial [Candidatus Omnitrophota bacterium]